MNKQQRDYLARRLDSEASKAKRKFTDDRPINWTRDEITARLRDNGFIVPAYGVHSGIDFPITPQMKRNKKAYDAFCGKVDQALIATRDRIYLGNTDAATILAEFTQQLQTLG